MTQPEMPSRKDSAAFRYRGLEQHYTIDLSPENPGALSRQEEILERTARIGLNRVYMGERWPDLGLRLIDYSETLPVLATSPRAGRIPRGVAPLFLSHLLGGPAARDRPVDQLEHHQLPRLLHGKIS